ncbi:MAG: hypothetical protein KatS3mg102_0328 [Planctomycetota bacterium]|nr:MAG: hypothetical protein KatS3mg102_0328 [Planctomycetota bacterium]
MEVEMPAGRRPRARAGSRLGWRRAQAALAPLLAAAWALGGPGAGAAAAAPEGSAFEFERNPGVRHAVPLEEIEKGIPRSDPRDAIPPLYAPRLVPAAEAGYLADGDRVLGLVLQGVARAYPIRLLERHEVVNDRFGDRPVVISYCPLCASGTAFEGKVGGAPARFGVSGYLYQSDLLLWDHRTESFWSQIEGRAVVGPATGERLELLPVENTTWGRWRALHPRTEVLAREQGIYPPAVYEREAYPGYAQSERIVFPVKHRSDRYPPKTIVAGVVIDGLARCWPLPELERAAAASFADRVGETAVRVHFDRQSGTVRVVGPAGEPLPVLRAFWFAWYTFHPRTEVWTAPASR